MTKAPTHQAFQPAYNIGTAILQGLATIGDDDDVVVVNHAYGLALVEGSLVVSWADIEDAYMDWLGELFRMFEWAY